MPDFNVEMINRDTGVSKTYQVSARSQTEAAEISHREGWVVGPVTEIGKMARVGGMAEARPPERFLDMKPRELARLIRWSVFWGMTLYALIWGLIGVVVAVIANL